ncbi:MAG: hypothetical protein ACYTEQ_01265 [Planctomycetota bacterium]|jgi:hypothetical protein
MKVEPKEIGTGHFWDSVWQNCEKETIARNILLLCQRRGDWVSFTWNEYRDFCAHDVSRQELGILEDFGRTGYLDKEGDAFKPTYRFIGALLPYAKKEELK